MAWFGGRSDLPLTGDATSRFLPWLIAPMVFLAAVALAASFCLTSLGARWDKDVAGTLTVEIAVPTGAADAAQTKTRAAVEKAIEVIKATPGVTAAEALTQEKM